MRLAKSLPTDLSYGLLSCRYQLKLPRTMQFDVITFDLTMKKRYTVLLDYLKSHRNIRLSSPIVLNPLNVPQIKSYKMKFLVLVVGFCLTKVIDTSIIIFVTI